MIKEKVLKKLTIGAVTAALSPVLIPAGIVIGFKEFIGGASIGWDVAMNWMKTQTLIKEFVENDEIA